MILTPLQKLTKNVRDLGKFIVAKCFELLPKVQKIAQSGHTISNPQYPLPSKGPCASAQTMHSLLGRIAIQTSKQPLF